MSNGGMDNGNGQVACRFVTRLGHAWEVPKSPISVPSELGRYGLSEIINALLSGKDESNVDVITRPFDFIIKGEMVRGSLQDFLERKKLSTELVIEIEYVFAVLPPSRRNSCPLEDWVRSVDASGNLILSGSYDGVTKLWNLDGDLVKECYGHSGAVTSVCLLNTDCPLNWEAKLKRGDTEDKINYCLTGSKDGTCRLWRIDSTDVGRTDKITENNTVVGSHAEAIECIASAEYHTHEPNSIRVASSGWDSMIRIWKVTRVESDGNHDPDVGEPAEKRMKVDKDAAKSTHDVRSYTTSEEELLLSEHTQCVSAVAWRRQSLQLISGALYHLVRADMNNTSFFEFISHLNSIIILFFGLNVYVGSWDHSVRLWDVSKGSLIDTLYTGRVVYSVACQRGANADVGDDIVAFAGASQVIKLWDTRSSGGAAISTMSLGCHSGWISSLSWYVNIVSSSDLYYSRYRNMTRIPSL